MYVRQSAFQCFQKGQFGIVAGAYGSAGGQGRVAAGHGRWFVGLYNVKAQA